MQLTALCQTEPELARLENSADDVADDQHPFRAKTILLAMKLTAFILLIASLHLSARGITQITFSGKDVPLEKVFEAIKKQTGYSFLYNSDLIKKARPVTIDVKNMPVEQVLTECLKGQPFEFNIESRTIFIVPKKNEISTISIESRESLDTKRIDVTGRVVNENGEPVSGVTVTIKGTKTITTTSDKGEFSLTSVDPEAILIFTHISLETFELKVSGKSELSITLKTKVSALRDVTISVNTGYQEIAKERATGSFYKLNEELVNRKVSPDIISRLEHVTSGFQIYRNQLSVRGRSTIFANDDPLIVVDNFPYDGDINNLNPNDIESITILKDAAAASIWGAFSGNGVVVITTKKGKYNQAMKVSFNANVTIGQKPDLFSNKAFLNSSDFIEVEQFLFSKGFYDATIDNTFDFPAISPVVEILAKERAGTITSSEATTKIEELKNIDARKEIEKYFYRSSINQQYALSLSAGGPKSSYFMSVGYDKILHNQTGNQNERITFNTNTAFNLLKNLDLTAGINFLHTYAKGDNTLRDVQGNIAASHDLYPYAKFMDADGSRLAFPKNYSNYFIDSMESKGLLNWRYNPLDEPSNVDNTNKVYDVRLNLGASYKILNGLKAEVRYQYLNSISLSEDLFKQESYYARDLINRFTTINSDGSFTTNIPFGAILNNFTSRLTSNSGRAQLSFDRRFQRHSISAIGGIDIREIKSKNEFSSKYGYDINTGAFTPVNYDSLFPTLPSGISNINFLDKITGTLNRFRSYFGNVAYTFDKRYTVSLSGRVDQSNFFGYRANQRSVPLWSSGIKWNISNEGFYKSKFLPLLSIRITYGYNGNLDKTTTPLTLSRVLGNSSYTNLPYATIERPGNPQLTWERIGILNMGIDFSIFRDIISGSIEYFHKKGTNMIGDDVLDPTTGFSSVTGNFSNMKGHGFDLVLNSKNTNREIQWTTMFLFSYAVDEVTKYKGTNAISRILEGKPVQGLYAFKWAGLDPVNGDPQGVLDGNLSTDWSTITSQPLKDQVYIGSQVPTIFGSILNSITWKKLSISINASYKAAYYFIRPSINYFTLYQFWRGHEDYSKRWQKIGDEKLTSIPSMPYPINSIRETFYSNSEILVEKGDHIRLEDIRFGYEFNKRRNNSWPFQTLQVYAYVNNIGVIWKSNKNGIDPNYPNGYLPPRTFAIGIKSNF